MDCSYNSKTKGVSAVKSNHTAIALNKNTYDDEFPQLQPFRASKLKRKKSACSKWQIQKFPEQNPIQVQSIKDDHDNSKKAKYDKSLPKLQLYNVRLILYMQYFEILIFLYL